MKISEYCVISKNKAKTEAVNMKIPEYCVISKNKAKTETVNMKISSSLLFTCLLSCCAHSHATGI